MLAIVTARRSSLGERDGSGAFAVPGAGRSGMRRKAAHAHDVRVSLVAPDDAQLMPTARWGLRVMG